MTGRVLGLAAALLMMGCAAPAAPSPPSQIQMEPQRGGVFQMVANRGLSNLNPVNQPGSNVGSYISGGLYDQLVDWEYTPEEDWRFASRVLRRSDEGSGRTVAAIRPDRSLRAGRSTSPDPPSGAS